MAEAPDQLERQIVETHAELDDKLSRLGHRARDTLSIRRRVCRRPWVALGSAAAAGLVAGLVRGKGRVYERRRANPRRRANDRGIQLAEFGERRAAPPGMQSPSKLEFRPGPVRRSAGTPGGSEPSGSRDYGSE
ncbi:MAG: hypothetical protein ACE148_01145 [Vicinamibacterales bacterium]